MRCIAALLLPVVRVALVVSAFRPFLLLCALSSGVLFAREPAWSALSLISSSVFCLLCPHEQWTFVGPPACLSACLSVCLTVCLSVCLPVGLSVCLFSLRFRSASTPLSDSSMRLN